MSERISIKINLMDPDECGCISWDGENTCPHQVAVEKTCSEMAQHVAVSIGEITKENDELKNMYAYLFSHLDMLCDELTFSAILEGLQIICTIMGDDVAADLIAEVFCLDEKYDGVSRNFLWKLADEMKDRYGINWSGDPEEV